ncbi:hypothetical protein D3C81_2171570 [compost metagenome]
MPPSCRSSTCMSPMKADASTLISTCMSLGTNTFTSPIKADTLSLVSPMGMLALVRSILVSPMKWEIFMGSSCQ